MDGAFPGLCLGLLQQAMGVITIALPPARHISSSGSHISVIHLPPASGWFAVDMSCICHSFTSEPFTVIYAVRAALGNHLCDCPVASRQA